MLWVTAREEGKNISEISRGAHVSRKAIYKWLGRYEESGIAGLMPKKPGAVTGTHPSAISKRAIARVIDLYEEENYGIRSIVHLLSKENIFISHMTVYRYLVNLSSPPFFGQWFVNGLLVKSHPKFLWRHL